MLVFNEVYSEQKKILTSVWHLSVYTGKTYKMINVFLSFMRHCIIRAF